jgi:group I intron endonuclease
MIIYVTTNLINNKKYIGKDSNNNPEYLGSGTLLREAIKKYGKENFKKEILEHCHNDEELHLKESYWIQKYNAVESDDFYNIVDFSAGWNLDKLGKEKYEFVINKISLNGRGIKKDFSKAINRSKNLQNSSKGKPKPKGFAETISQIKKGKKLSPSHRIKISEGKKGKKQPSSFSEKKNKPIYQLDKENNIINTFKSINDAANSNIKFKRSNISCCLTGFSKTAYRFKWVYV